MTTAATKVPSSVDIARADSECAYGSDAGVLIACWRGDIKVESVRQLLAYRDEMLKHHFIGAVHMVEEAVHLPPAEVRAAARAGVAARGNVRPGIAIIIFGSGFGAATLRSVGTAIFTLRSGPPTRILGDVKSAATWLSERVELGSVDPNSLALACESIRRAGV